MNGALKEEIRRLKNFNKLLFEKNMMRFAAYVVWFFLFLAVWLMAFMDQSERASIAGALAAGIFAILYASLLKGKHKNDYYTGILPVGIFFPITKKAWIFSKYLFMLKFLGTIEGMILVQGLFLCAVTGFMPFLLVMLEIVFIFIAVSGIFTLMMLVNNGGY